MIVKFSDVIHDISILTFWQNPICHHITQLTFADENIDVALNPSQLKSVVDSFSYSERNHFIILVLNSLYHYDRNIDASELMFMFFELLCCDKTTELGEWLKSILYDNNGNLEAFHKEYLRLKLQHPLSNECGGIF